jgi:Asp-tRNA(Asn)/Glu-tRNA(Gln) amidotransferase A subunit family amidase
MAWNVSGNPAATVRVAETNGLPINVQVVTARWRDLLALDICSLLEKQFGGWRPASFNSAVPSAPVDLAP